MRPSCATPSAAAVALAMLLLFVPSPRPAASPLVRHEASRMSMGSLFEIVAYGRDAATLSRSVEDAFDEVDRLDRLMSHYKPDSPLSRLNREAANGAVRVDPELFDLIAEAVRYSRVSDGAFDITVGPLMKTWGFYLGDGRLPARDELAGVRARVGYRHLVLNAAEHTIRFDRSGVELDLGGIGKGYAVDRVVSLLKARGVTAALVNSGGSTVYGLGAPPDRDGAPDRGWDVELQDPVDARKVARVVHLKDRALSVSGSANKFFEVNGVRYAHIMDPRTGQPAQGVLSVAVITGTGTAGDALDNVLFVQGVARGRLYLAQHEAADTEAFFFLPGAAARTWTMVHVPPRASRRAPSSLLRR